MAQAVVAAAVVQRFGRSTVVGPLDLEIEVGRHVAITGDNGAGKSTLLRMMATVTRPASGRLEVFGLDSARDSVQIRRRIGYVGHQLGLYPRLNASENLELFCALHGVPPSHAVSLLALVGLAGRGRDLVEDLSRGMQQRLALARSLLHDPQLWILDEPDASLDGAGRALLAELMVGRTVVMATHQRDSLQLCDSEVRLEGGRLASPPALAIVRGAGS